MQTALAVNRCRVIARTAGLELSSLRADSAHAQLLHRKAYTVAGRAVELPCLRQAQSHSHHAPFAAIARLSSGLTAHARARPPCHLKQAVPGLLS